MGQSDSYSRAGSITSQLIPHTHSTIKHLPQATMKIKKLFSFSSQKSSKSCDSLETILRQPQQQVGGSSGGSGIRAGVKGDIHSEYVINEMLGKGGFGRVFSARRICDGTEVAVKEVVKDARYKTDNKNNNSLPTEIALMQQVQHVEGVIKIL